MSELRKLGAVETMFDMVMPDANDIYVQIFLLRCARSIERDSLVDGVRAWSRRHPLLRARVETRADGRYFMRMDGDVDDAVHVDEGRREWIQLAEDELQRPIDTSRGPLWRIHVARTGDGGYVMTFTVLHAIMDTINAVQAGFELLNILSGKAPRLPSVDAVYPSIDRLLFQSDCYDGPAPATDIPWMTPGRKIPAAMGDPSIERGRCRILPFALDEATTLQLVRESKRHGVKMNSTFCCLAALAHAQLFQSHGEPFSPVIAVRTAVSARPLLAIGPEHLGFYVPTAYYPAVLRATVAESLDAFWPIAKAMNDHLHSRLTRSHLTDLVKLGSLGLQPTLAGVALHDDAHFFQSNAGILNYPPSGDPDEIVLDDIHFMNSLLEDTWLVPLFHTMMTFNGRVLWTIGYHEKALRTPLMEVYKQLILNLIARITRPLPGDSG